MYVEKAKNAQGDSGAVVFATAPNNTLAFRQETAKRPLSAGCDSRLFGSELDCFVEFHFGPEAIERWQVDLRKASAQPTVSYASLPSADVQSIHLRGPFVIVEYFVYADIPQLGCRLE